MTDDRDPARLLESDCDPLLRRVLESARHGTPDSSHMELLAQRIERAAVRDAMRSGSLRKRAAGFAKWLVWLAVGAAAVWWVKPPPLPSISRAARVAPTTVTPEAHSLAAMPVHEPRAASSPVRAGVAQRGEPTSLAQSLAEPASRVPAERSVASGSVRSNHAQGPRHAEPKRARVYGAGLTAAGQNPAAADTTAPPKPTDVPPELQLLAAAQRALRDSPSHALALANVHARDYPSGLFVEEREEIAIEALLKLGELDAGHARGRAFLARYPQSAHAGAIARMLDARY